MYNQSLPLNAQNSQDTMGEIKQFKLDIPSLPENIRIVESFVENVKDQFAISDDLYGNIMVCVTEAVNNAILHGNEADSLKMVQLILEVSPQGFCFSVKDEGEGFDYDNVPDPTSPENIDRIGGRGIFLINSLCDNVTYRENGSLIRMNFPVKS